MFSGEAAEETHDQCMMMYVFARVFRLSRSVSILLGAFFGFSLQALIDANKYCVQLKIIFSKVIKQIKLMSPVAMFCKRLKAVKINWYANDYSKGRSLCKLDSPASHTNLS